MATGLSSRRGRGRPTRVIPPNRLRELRGTNTLFAQAGELGIDDAQLWRYERQMTSLPDELKIRFAAHFGVSISYLMCDWDTPEAA